MQVIKSSRPLRKNSMTYWASALDARKKLGEISSVKNPALSNFLNALVSVIFLVWLLLRRRLGAFDTYILAQCAYVCKIYLRPMCIFLGFFLRGVWARGSGLGRGGATGGRQAGGGGGYLGAQRPRWMERYRPMTSRRMGQATPATRIATTDQRLVRMRRVRCSSSIDF